MMINLLTLGILYLSQSAFAGTHSLKYFYTGTSEDDNFPAFIAVGMVDDEQIDYYDSNIKRDIPKQKWMEDNMDASYWEDETQKKSGWDTSTKVNIDILTKRFNQTGGIHTLQLMYGCELDDEGGTPQGFLQYGYDGGDIMSFDLKSLTWTATMNEALITKKKWDENMAFNQQNKNYLQQICIEWLNKYVNYGESVLKRQVSPQVLLTHKPARSGGTDITCHVTGFFPRDIEVMWHNGGPRDLNVESGEVLPNEDGTYQIKKTLKLNAKLEELSKGQYSCHVDHSSLKQKMIIEFDPKSGGSLIPVIIGVVALVLLILAAVIGFIIWKKKQGSGSANAKFSPVEKGDDSSSGSSATA